MKIRKWKLAALLATSSVILQVGGCGSLIFQILAQQVFSGALRTILDGLLGNGDTTTPTE